MKGPELAISSAFPGAGTGGTLDGVKINTVWPPVAAAPDPVPNLSGTASAVRMKGINKSRPRSMTTERRHQERREPADLTYLQFGLEGGGIVLNASEEGLAFQAATATEWSSPVALCISPVPRMRISLTAEIVWMDEKGKSGGVRFANLSSDARKKVSAWLTKASEPEPPFQDLFSPRGRSESASSALPRAHSREEDLPPPTRQSADARSFCGGRLAASVTQRERLSPAAFLKRFRYQRQLWTSRSRWTKGIATALFIASFIFFPLALISDLRFGIGDTLVRLGLKLNGNSPAPPVDSVPQIDSTAPSTTAAAPSDAPSSSPIPRDLLPDVASPETSKQPAAGTLEEGPEALPVPDRIAPRERRSPDISGLNGVQRSSTGVSRDVSRGTLAQRLWSAVAKGSVSAEVALAQLYLKGDGVHKNCEQARVLLRAASKRGSSEASRQLQSLKNSGCP